MQAPNAPGRKHNNCRTCGQPQVQSLWQFLKNTGGVRAKYLSYTPEDVEEIDDIDTLRWLYDKYHMPASQPQTVEESMYQCLMSFHLGVKIDSLQK